MKAPLEVEFIVVKHLGDATSAYDLRVSRPCTVKEFILWVLTHADEWGRVRVRTPREAPLAHDLEYKKGVLIAGIPDDLADRLVTRASASGGWSSMNYTIYAPLAGTQQEIRNESNA